MCLDVNIIFQPITNKIKQDVAEVVPRSSFVKVEVEFEVDVGVEVGVEVRVEVEDEVEFEIGVEVGVEVEVKVRPKNYFFGVDGLLEK